MVLSERKWFTFIDLFAGVGGIRVAFERAGGGCVFSSEYDEFSQATYRAFFNEVPAGDITGIDPSLIPDHDILTGGFPCQPFSLAGVSKKKSLNRPHGFDDPTQGTLFFNIKEIIGEKRPKAFLLENVKNLKSHDGGKTFAIIERVLTGELAYRIFYRVIDSSAWVPQHRERIFIVGFREDLGITKEDFSFPDPPWKRLFELDEILEDRVSEKYILGQGTWDTLERHLKHHRAKGQGFGYGLVEPPFGGKVTRTLSARYYKDGAEILISRGEARRPRRLTPLECMRLQGFGREFEKFFNGSQPQPVSDSRAYRQFGNSVTVPVVAAIARNIVRTLKSKDLWQRPGGEDRCDPSP